MNQSKKSRSIRQKLLFPMMGFIALQLIVLLVAFFGTGSIDELKANAYNDLTNKVENRRNAIQTKMVQNWSNYDNFSALVARSKQETKNNINDAKISTEMGEDLISLLRSSFATGAFIFYDRQIQGSDERAGLYLRDLDPNSLSVNNSDILVEIGSGALVKELGLTMDSNWTAYASFDDVTPGASFYDKVKQGALQYPEIEPADLGYWSKPFRLNPIGLEIITYSFPLRDDNGAFIGVAGIEVTLDYLYTLMQYSEIAEDQKGGYVLGISEDQSNVECILEAGPMFKNVGGQSNSFQLVPDEGSLKNIYEINSEAIDEKIVGIVKSFRLYNTNTPFEKEEWMLIGVINQSDLFTYVNRLQGSLLLAFLITLFLGILGCFGTSAYFAAPFRRMAEALKKSDPEETILLPKVQIDELDELASAVENLSADVAYSASRLSQILEIVEMPIGSIEVDKDKNEVFIRGKVAQLLDIPDKKYMTFTEFENAIEHFRRQSYLYSKEEQQIKGSMVSSHTLHYTNDAGVSRWVNFKRVELKSEELIVIQDLTADIKEKLKIEYERDYDVLTHLMNRRSYKNKVEEFINAPISGTGAMVMWDLDNLKYINDTYGHDFGDQYIREAAKVFATLRVQNAVVGRISGDEFMAFFYQYASKEEIRAVVLKIHEKLLETQMHLPNQKHVKIRASAGIAWYPDDGLTYEELSKYSDFAMYRAKTTMKGKVQEFDKTQFRQDEVLFSGKEELNRFIEKGLVRFAFQPIVDSINGEVHGFEALMRPQSEYLKTVGDVLRVARAQSKLYAIERLTVTNAMKEYRKQRSAFKEARIFLNSIPNTCLSAEDMKMFEEEYESDLNKIVIEIIEIEQTDSECMKIKQRFKERWGCGVALDDFGAGYGTESSLLYISPNYVKIDYAIVHGVDTDEDRKKLILNILSYTKPRNMKVIAEGIETLEEMQTLIGLGVDYLQGFFVGKPDFDVHDISKEKRSLIKAAYEQSNKENI